MTTMADLVQLALAMPMTTKEASADEASLVPRARQAVPAAIAVGGQMRSMTQASGSTTC